MAGNNRRAKRGGAIGSILREGTINDLLNVPGRLDNEENRPRVDRTRANPLGSRELVRVKNTTDDDLERFAPIVLDDIASPPESPIIGADGVVKDFLDSFVFKGANRTFENALKMFGVCEEPIAVDAIGLVRVGGFAQIPVTLAEDEVTLQRFWYYVAPSFDNANEWRLSDSWGFPVIWHERGGVRNGPAAAEAAGVNVFLGDGENQGAALDTPTTNPFFAVVNCSAMQPPETDFAFVAVEMGNPSDDDLPTLENETTTHHLDPLGIFEVQETEGVKVNANGVYQAVLSYTYDGSEATTDATLWLESDNSTAVRTITSRHIFAWQFTSATDQADVIYAEFPISAGSTITLSGAGAIDLKTATLSLSMLCNSQRLNALDFDTPPPESP